MRKNILHGENIYTEKRSDRFERYSPDLDLDPEDQHEDSSKRKSENEMGYTMSEFHNRLYTNRLQGLRTNNNKGYRRKNSSLFDALEETKTGLGGSPRSGNKSPDMDRIFDYTLWFEHIVLPRLAASRIKYSCDPIEFLTAVAQCESWTSPFIPSLNEGGKELLHFIDMYNSNLQQDTFPKEPKRYRSNYDEGDFKQSEPTSPNLVSTSFDLKLTNKSFYEPEPNQFETINRNDILSATASYVLQLHKKGLHEPEQNQFRRFEEADAPFTSLKLNLDSNENLFNSVGKNEIAINQSNSFSENRSAFVPKKNPLKTYFNTTDAPSTSFHQQLENRSNFEADDKDYQFSTNHFKPPYQDYKSSPEVEKDYMDTKGKQKFTENYNRNLQQNLDYKKTVMKKTPTLTTEYIKLLIANVDKMEKSTIKDAFDIFADNESGIMKHTILNETEVEIANRQNKNLPKPVVFGWSKKKEKVGATAAASNTKIIAAEFSNDGNENEIEDLTKVVVSKCPISFKPTPTQTIVNMSREKERDLHRSSHKPAQVESEYKNNLRKREHTSRRRNSSPRRSIQKREETQQHKKIHPRKNSRAEKRRRYKFPTPPRFPSPRRNLPDNNLSFESDEYKQNKDRFHLLQPYKRVGLVPSLTPKINAFILPPMYHPIQLTCMPILQYHLEKAVTSSLNCLYKYELYTQAKVERVALKILNDYLRFHSTKNFYSLNDVLFEIKRFLEKPPEAIMEDHLAIITKEHGRGHKMVDNLTWFLRYRALVFALCKRYLKPSKSLNHSIDLLQTVENEADVAYPYYCGCVPVLIRLWNWRETTDEIYDEFAKNNSPPKKAIGDCTKDDLDKLLKNIFDIPPYEKEGIASCICVQQVIILLKCDVDEALRRIVKWWCTEYYKIKQINDLGQLAKIEDNLDEDLVGFDEVISDNDEL